jgi:hypothetical protein
VDKLIIIKIMIEISPSILKKCQQKKYIWNEKQKEQIVIGNLWECLTQIYLGVDEKDIQLREGKKGVDSGIDIIIQGMKIQCKAVYLNGPKHFILLDRIINYNVDFYSLGIIHENYQHAELVHYIKTSELVTLIEVGKIVYHSTYEKWAYIINSAIQWIDNQQSKKTLTEGIIQNIGCFIYSNKK